MSLFCCKLPQLPNGIGRSQLAGLSTSRKVAAVTAEGNLMTQITDVRTVGQRLLHPLRMGHFNLFPPRECMWCSHLRSHCHRHTFQTWADLFALSHPDSKGKGKSSESPMELCLPNLSIWRRASSRSRAEIMLVYSRHPFTLETSECCKWIGIWV